MRHLTYCLAFSFLIFMLGGCMPNADLRRAEELMEPNPDSALKVLKAINPSSFYKSSDKALYSLLLSQAYDRNQIYITSDSIINTAVQYYGKDDPRRAGSAWFYSSRCARNRGNAEVQAQQLFKAQEFADLTDNYKLRALIYCDKADMYKAQQQRDSSIMLNKKGLWAFTKANDQYNMCLTALTIGRDCKNDPMTGIRYLKYAENMAKKNEKLRSLLLPIYKCFGNCYVFMKNYRKAIEYYKMAPKVEEEYHNQNKLYLISSAYMMLGEIDSADFYIQQVHLPVCMDAKYYMVRRYIAYKRNDLKQALHYSDRLIQVKDSFYAHSLNASFAGLERRFKYDKLNEQNNGLKIENARKTTIILIISLVVSLGIIAFMYWSLLLNKRKLEIERQLNETEKDLTLKANENNKLLQMQNDLQQQLLLFIEQYRLMAEKGNVDIQVQARIDDENIRKQIMLYVDCKYNNISQRLYKEYLDFQLTERDVFICCMLLAGFTTGMIAVILNLQLSSVNILRGRLRKKLKIDSNEKLTEALSKL